MPIVFGPQRTLVEPLWNPKRNPAAAARGPMSALGPKSSFDEFLRALDSGFRVQGSEQFSRFRVHGSLRVRGSEFTVGCFGGSQYFMVLLEGS